MLVRIVKDVPADSKEGRQALHSSVAGNPSSQETTSSLSLSVSSTSCLCFDVHMQLCYSQSDGCVHIACNV